MEGLSNRQLEAGKQYRCLLSNRLVIVTQVEIENFTNPNGDIEFITTTEGAYYNKAIGRVELYTIPEKTLTPCA